MRSLRIVVATVILLVPAVAAARQTPAPSAAPAAPVVAAAGQVPGAPAAAVPADAEEPYIPPLKNEIDFGLRGSNVSGDRARYERYRDLANGLFFEGFRLHRATGNDWFLDASGDHVGRRDQRFAGSLVLPGKVAISGRWDQLPTLMSNTTRTLFTAGAPAVLTIDDALQAQVQASAAALRGIVDTRATVFTLESRRHIGDAELEYIATPALTFTQSFRMMDRTGAIPYGGSWGHGNFSETFAPVNHRLTDWNGNGEFAHGPVLFRAGYVASFFKNEFSSFSFDNPFRAVDASSASSRGRSSLPPSNSMFGVNGLASVRLPGRSRASAYISTSMLKDASGTGILPQTINSATAASALQPLSRATVDGEGRATSVNLTFTSRPVRTLDVNARYRTYTYDNRTPVFHSFQRVSYDNSPSNVAAGLETEPFGVERRDFLVDVRVIPRSALSAGVGYSRFEEDRTFRVFRSTTEDVSRLTVDFAGTRWFSLRTKFEHSQKRSVRDEEHFKAYSAIEQPGLMHFDIAPRDRNRATLLATVIPVENLSLSVSAAGGRDDYLESQFGMRDSTHRVYSAGFDSTLGARVVLSALYTFENYTALSRSRAANPGVQFVDETRNWATDTTDRVHSVVASVDVTGIRERLDVRFSADASRARATYDYLTGALAEYLVPGETPNLVSTLATPKPLEPERSDFTRGTVDALYAVTSRVSIGMTYWHERYRVTNVSLDERATPSLNLANSLLLGYVYRPYTANTFWGRVVYRW